MSQLNPDKLHVTFLEGAPPDRLSLPRVYTLTHSDFTGDMYLTIGNKIMKRQISGWYTRLMRDEVWAEWISGKTDYELLVHCHVSGGLVLGSARWRYDIFKYHMPLVLEAFRYGDRVLFECHPHLEDTSIKVSFHSNVKKYNHVELWQSFKAFGQKMSLNHIQDFQ